MKKRKALVQKRRLTEAVRLKLIPALKGFILFKCLPKRLFFSLVSRSPSRKLNRQEIVEVH